MTCPLIYNKLDVSAECIQTNELIKMIIGTGIDIVDICRIRRSLNSCGELFKDRVFTGTEQSYSSTLKDDTTCLSEYFAAKEALAKAIGTGFSDGIALKEVEVTRPSGASPEVKLYGKALQTATELGVKRVLLSLAHEANLAVAFVVLEG